MGFTTVTALLHSFAWERGLALALVMVLLWIGSGIAGWLLFWPWLAAPLAVVALYMMRVAGGFRAARLRNGLPLRGSLRAGTSMVPANIRLLTVTLVQHLAIFGFAATIHWMLR